MPNNGYSNEDERSKSGSAHDGCNAYEKATGDHNASGHTIGERGVNGQTTGVRSANAQATGQRSTIKRTAGERSANGHGTDQRSTNGQGAGERNTNWRGTIKQFMNECRENCSNAIARVFSGRNVNEQATNELTKNAHDANGQTANGWDNNGQPQNRHSSDGQARDERNTYRKAQNKQVANGRNANGQAPIELSSNGQTITGHNANMQTINTRDANGQTMTDRGTTGEAQIGHSSNGRAMNRRDANGQVPIERSSNEQAMNRRDANGQASIVRSSNEQLVSRRNANGQVPIERVSHGQAPNKGNSYRNAPNGRDANGQVPVERSSNGPAINKREASGQAANGQAIKRRNANAPAINERSANGPTPNRHNADLQPASQRSRAYYPERRSQRDEDALFSPVNNDIPQRARSQKVPADKVYVNMDDAKYDGISGNLNGYERWRKVRLFLDNVKRVFRMIWKFWCVVRPVVMVVLCVALAYVLLQKVGSKLYKDYIMPVAPDDPTPIVVEIPSGSGASDIAKLLYEAGGEDGEGLISHKAIFKIYVDFIGKSSRLQAGTYVLSRNMSIPEIVDIICKGNPPRETISVTIPEGLTVEATANKLVELGVFESADRFIELCVTGDAFKKDHPFIDSIPQDASGERKYVLEGFLFPDTYDLYADGNEETLIDKMLTRFEQIFGPIYTARANELGMTSYEVITLASMIEKEAKTFDFKRVAAVFSNRAKLNMPYESDASIEYVLKTGSLHFTAEQLATPSLYNTHINKGLPLGPIANPGDAAIAAALYPDEQYMEEGYLYFCLMEQETGALVFAKTLEEHNRNVAKYSPNW